jgi:hypothetical protein
MPLISSSIPNLINGVSQQPAALRLASQAETVVNCLPSPVEGLKKRPPCYHVAKLFAGSAGAGRPFTHIVDRDGVTKYLIIIQDSAIKVFGLDGSVKTVSNQSSYYLDVTGEPSKTFRVASIADYTFIVNREVGVAMASGGGNLSPNWGTKSMVFIKTADYATTYSITVNGVTVSDTTASSGGSVPSNVTIATNLAASLNANSTFNAAFVATQTDYIVRITKNDGGAYTLSSKDTRNGAMTIAIKGTVDTLSDLPTIAEHGFTVKILGSKSTGLDDYYVKFETNTGSGFGHGIWRETVAPGIPYLINPATMPHVLIDNGGTFTFTQFTWAGRVAGDTLTAPDPSFIGSKIQNLQLFRNRLAFLADENVILSAADSYDRFFPETVQTIVDSDPIDISTGGQEINFLVSSLVFANSLLLFSRHSQFRLDTGNVAAALTPKTASIAALTTFEMVDTVDPVAVGRTIFFAIPKGEFSGVREFFLPDSSGPVPISEEVTSPVPRFIPDALASMTATVSEEGLVLLSKDEPRRIYLYKFFFQDDTKLQSSWSYWELEGVKTIVGADILDSDLYLTVEYADGVYLERVALRPETVDAGTSIELLVDRKTTEASCTVALTNAAGLDVQSTITLPYPINNTSSMAVVGRYFAGNTMLHGQVLMPISQTLAGGTGGNGTLVVRGNLTAAKFYVGELYDLLYEFSTQYIKEQPPGGGMAIAAGPKLQLRTWTMIFDKTSSFEIKITPRGRDTNTYPYNAITPGDASLLGSLEIKTNRFRVPVMTENLNAVIRLTSSSPLPCRFQSAEWEGWYHTRATRL